MPQAVIRYVPEYVIQHSRVRIVDVIVGVEGVSWARRSIVILLPSIAETIIAVRQAAPRLRSAAKAVERIVSVSPITIRRVSARCDNVIRSAPQTETICT